MNKVNKADILEFLQDAVELETKAFTLMQLGKEYDDIAERLTFAIDRRIKSTKEDCKSKESLVQFYKEEEKAQRKLVDENRERLVQLKEEYEKIKAFQFDKKNIKISDSNKGKVSDSQTAGCGIGCATSIIVFMLTGGVVSVLGYFFSDWSPIFSILGLLFSIVVVVALCIIGSIIGGNIARKHIYRKQQKEILSQEIKNLKRYVPADEEGLRKKEKLVRIAEEQLQSSKMKLDQLLSEKKALEQQIQCAGKQATQCRNSANAINETLQKLYSAVELVPPDYRELDCVLAFQQIFRNDLADTMREAVMIYEQRVFRQEVIRGISQIYNQLDDLNASMHYVKHSLCSIRDNVSMMSQDLYQIAGKMGQIAEGINDSNELQTKILAETQASRYAVEALQQSQDKYAEYMQKIQDSNDRMEKHVAEWEWERKNP